MKTVDLSLRTVFVALLYLGALWFLFVIRDVLAILIMAVVLSAALDPTVSKMEKFGVPRGLAIATLYIILAGLVTVIVVTFVPVVTTQFIQLVNALPDIAQKLLSVTNVVPGSGTTSISGVLSHVGSGFFAGLRTVIGGVVAFAAVLVLTFYLTLEEQAIRRMAAQWTPVRYRTLMHELMEKVELHLGRWLRGQLLLGLIVGTAVGIGLVLLHVKYALALAVIAGMTELIPTVGPYIGLAPALLVAYSQSPTLAIWTTLLYYGVQQLENNFLVPKIMSRAAGVNPIVVLIALLVGAQLAGIIGILLSVPMVIIGQTILDTLLRERQQEEPEPAA